MIQTSPPRPLGRRPAFTLVELLVVVAVLALLIGLLLPTVRSVQRSARNSACLTNIRALEMAHLTYAAASKGYLADARLPHGGADLGSTESFVSTLKPYLDDASRLMRSPLDDSPHWPVSLGGEGIAVRGSGGKRFRQTSYGINNHLCRAFSAWAAIDPARLTDRLQRIPSPATTVHTLCMASTGDFAGADHPHVETWGAGTRAGPLAAAQAGTGWAGGTPSTGDARGNYGFADGHVASETFGRLYLDMNANAFDPLSARTFRP